MAEVIYLSMVNQVRSCIRKRFLKIIYASRKASDKTCFYAADDSPNSHVELLSNTVHIV